MVDKLAGANLSEADLRHFETEGYLIVRGLFAADEVEALRRNFAEMHAQRSIPGCFEALPIEEARRQGSILKAYPRMMHPHRVNRLSMDYMLDPRVMDILAALLGEEPIAAQSMFYWKPPGAEGQALHQDNFYLKVEPGTCIAAWTAIDDADEENGGLFVVPKSQHEPIQCPHRADPSQSFTVDEVDVPEGLTPMPTTLKAGDVLFFNGSVIHGSYPNRSKDRFRRAFICHYAGESAEKIGKWYSPLYNRQGEIVEREDNAGSGPCGTEFAATGPH
ncbi:phytanoyl-CoA dioxygenase [Paenibacillus sp. 32O-W]|uniref:phytanoyl-CoA dioxygenase family protein n=1 Tax=Paenibacillus sp. 32O-W TaxID=1695218 RepID=UPI0007205AB4|nr:phytanoyl-CoA dioxygenase family protein [Paenibacillus sp. 32O-W]ALS28464.1 phytanoyl-CoA dioxygenase [Paenibacillus sp. 32O-W]